MILTGMPVSAQEMEQRGIVNRVVSADEDVLEVALGVAQRIAARSAPALRLAKHVVKAGKEILRNNGCNLWLTETSRDHHIGGGVGD